jgi:extradiol dioxygenase family protein
VHLRAGRSQIDLVDVDGEIGRKAGAAPASEGHNMDHVALRLEAFDEAELRAHLQAHGVEPGEVVTRFGAEGDGPSMYIADPEGNTVELKGPPAD